jgi:hypothetical protein
MPIKSQRPHPESLRGEDGDSRFFLGAAPFVGMTSIRQLGMFRLASLGRDSRGGGLYVVRRNELKTIEVVKVGSANL